ncbi:MAG TPA: hypothetical protein VEL07_20040 [Planctomycetota bacterium]|nr:hypothetical protein [Planctomycetota bacterium]
MHGPRRLALLDGAEWSDRVDDGRQVTTARRSHDGCVSEWSMTATAEDPFITITVSITAGSAALRVVEVRPLVAAWSTTHLADEVAVARWWVVPSSAWDRPGTRPLGGAVDADDCASIAFDAGGAYAPSGAALTLGCVRPTRWINRIDADARELTLTSTVGIDLAPGEVWRSDPLLIDLRRPITVALADLARRGGGRRVAADAAQHHGWSTWDFFTDKVVETDVDGALAAIAARPAIRSRLRYVVIDDFWQDRTGDWRPGARFGSIEASARKIIAAGLTPGIWTAPFFADRHSEVLKAHPDYALRLDDGQIYTHCQGCDPPWGDRAFLDPTHPGVREHLFALYRRLRGWGFRYFKTDFLTDAICAEFPGERAKYGGRIRYHDPGAGLVRAHRACMETIRAAIGPESFWLGCGTHFATGAWLMDATRISSDMRVHHPNLVICARSAIFDFHLHGGPFLVDPDFAVFRGRDTTLPGALELPPLGTKPYALRTGDSGPTFDLAEARLWAAVVIMSGGVVMLSDKLDGLNDDGLRIVETVLAHGGGEAARPIDLFTPLPRIWLASRGRTTWLLVANWGDEPATITLPDDLALPTGPATDVWSGERIGVARGAAVALPRHGHRLLRWE